MRPAHALSTDYELAFLSPTAPNKSRAYPESAASHNLCLKTPSHCGEIQSFRHFCGLCQNRFCGVS